MYDVNPSDMHACLQFTMHDIGGHMLFSTIPHRTPQVAGESAKTGASPGAAGPWTGGSLWARFTRRLPLSVQFSKRI